MDLFKIAPEVFALFAEYSHICANSENQVFAAANSRSTDFGQGGWLMLLRASQRVQIPSW